MTSRRLFVINPNARRADPDELVRLIRELPGNRTCETCVCRDPDELASQYGPALKNGRYETVVAVGGDGTVRECIGLIARRWKTRLGIVPTGTNNLLAKSLNIPLNPREALETLLTGKTQAISISEVNGKKYFTISFGVGLDARIMLSTPRSLKQRIGVMAYWWESLHHIHTRHYPFRLLIDDVERTTRGKGIIVINRNSYIKALFPFAPPPDPSEPASLDICVLHPHTFWEFVNVGWKILSGEYYGKIDHYQGRSVEITCSEKIPRHIDGDPFDETEIRIRHLRNQLKVIVPS